MRQQGMSLGDILETLPSRKREQRSQVIEFPKRRGDRAVEGARLEIVCAVNPAPRVRIPPSPPLSRILIEHSDFSNDRKRVGSNSVDSRDVDC